jgi:hypothetical protein
MFKIEAISPEKNSESESDDMTLNEPVKNIKVFKKFKFFMAFNAKLELFPFFF